LQDVIAGFVEPEAARADYGVVIRAGKVDQQETDMLRTSPRPTSNQSGFGPERDAWESVFDDKRMLMLVDALMAYPSQLRTSIRQNLFHNILPGLGAKPLPELLADTGEISSLFDAAIDGLKNGILPNSPKNAGLQTFDSHLDHRPDR
jgi:N-methylhydantoinase B